MSDDSQDAGLTGWKIDQLDFPTFRISLLAKIMDRVTIRTLSQQTDLSYAQWRVLARLGLMRAAARCAISRRWPGSIARRSAAR
jgi:DNA-binding MarR family transcriptional regulator